MAINFCYYQVNRQKSISITDTTLYVWVVTLSIQDNAKLLAKLKSYFKRTINWSKYQSERSIEREKTCLDYLTDPSFEGVNRHFDLSFEDYDVRKGHKKFFLQTADIKVCNVMIDGKSFFDQPVKNELRKWLHNWLFTRLCLFQKLS